jgi:UDP-N-acetylmuramoyl-tripeptide--D-alanyl-D-alanine ligase
MMAKDVLTLSGVVETLAEYRLESKQAITKVVIDSRDVVPGALFVALPGEQTDGHTFIADAFAGGAVAALVERDVQSDGVAPAYLLDLRQPIADEAAQRLELPVILRVDDTLRALQQIATSWRNRFDDVRVIGITGSVGKTTTKELVYEVLRERYPTLKSKGNYNNEIGLPLTLLQMNGRHRRVVLEMGMYDVGEISELCDIASPHVGLLTIIGPVHMERAGSMERIVQAKRELVEALPPGPEGIAILNMDDDRVMSMAEHTQADIFTYGLDSEADLWADRLEGLGLEGIRFWLHHKGHSMKVRVPMLGLHSVHTALRAAAVGLVEGMSWNEILRGLQVSGKQLRLVAVNGPNGSVLLDDTYNASPESVIAALNLLAELDGRRVAVLGDMLELGAYEWQGHRLVGLRAREVADVLVTVGELGEIIAQEAMKGGMPRTRVQVMADSEETIAYLQDEVREGDIVLVKGSRGLRMDKIVAALARG